MSALPPAHELPEEAQERLRQLGELVDALARSGADAPSIDAARAEAEAQAAQARNERALRVEWRPLAAMETIAAEWRALAARALEPNVFYEPAFALSAASAFGRGVHGLLVWSQERLIGVLPARIVRRAAFPMMVGWTHPFAPLGTPLVDRERADGVVAVWLSHLARDRRMPKLLLLPTVPQSGAFSDVLGRALARRALPAATFDPHVRALLAPERDRGAYLEASLGAKKRKELRRQRRRLEEGGAVWIDTVTQPSLIGNTLEDFFRLEAAGWKGRVGTAARDREPQRRFMQRAVSDLAAEGKARIDRLVIGRRAIAAMVTLRSGGVAWTWKIAHDEEFARASPGVQLVCDVTDSLLREPAIAQVDSCADADHPMIDHIWRERLALSDRLIAVTPRSAGFPIVRRSEAMRRSLRAAAKSWRDRFRRR